DGNPQGAAVVVSLTPIGVSLLGAVRVEQGEHHVSERDVEKVYSNTEFAAKLRRLADAVETGTRFEIQIAGERIYVPSAASFSVEHERLGDEEEIEFQ